jgi:D-sedoheptulose 7-phosphate isomerase
MEIKDFINDFNNYLKLINADEVEALVSRIYKSYIDDTNIFIIGNGGSASNASHLAQDLSKGAIIDQKQQKRIKALSLTDNVSYITAVGNDDGFENIFTSQLRTFAKKEDVLISISCSGNSRNIIDAVEYAKSINMQTIGITGFDGGKLKRMSDYSVHIPLNDFGIVEAIHSVIFHYLVVELKSRIKDLKSKN